MNMGVNIEHRICGFGNPVGIYNDTCKPDQDYKMSFVSVLLVIASSFPTMTKFYK